MKTMKNKSLYIIVFLILSIFVFAQGDQKTKKDTTKTDTVKVDTVEIKEIEQKIQIQQQQIQEQQQQMQKILEKTKKSKSEGGN